MANQPRGKKTPPPPPSNGILGKLRPIELVAIGVLGFAVLMYAFSKCGGGSADTTPTDTTLVVPNGGTLTTPNTTIPGQANPGTTVGVRPLYIILDSVKLRRGPHLDSALVKFLVFGEEVYDMGKRTDFEQTVKISATETRTAPWVQVRTGDNKVGWVFGAGLEFYPKKRKGGNPTIDVPGTQGTTVTQPTTTTVTTPSTTTTTNNRNTNQGR